jgi:hypothetical protein
VVAVRFNRWMPKDGRSAHLYCLVDPRASAPLLAAVRDHFASEPEVTVLVERRGAHGDQHPAGPPEAGVHRAPVAERDAARLLPARLRDHVGRLRVVQPLAPLRRSHEDTDVVDLIAQSVALEPEATSELWWRIAPRVLARLELRLGRATDPDSARSVFGRVLDELPGFDPARDRLPAWLDAVVDRYVATEPPRPG